MPVNYSQRPGFGVTSNRSPQFDRYDIELAKQSLLDIEDIENVDKIAEEQEEGSVLESMGYSPEIGTTYTPTAPDKGDDRTDLSKDNQEGSLLDSDPKGPAGSELEPSLEDDINHIPDDVVNYYNESVLKADKRNKLKDEDFGLPRLRKYPLNDEKHVRQAIRMFGHCKNMEDQKTLAGRIFAKVEAFNMDVKIGKDNPLYGYAPKALQESSGNSDAVAVFGFEHSNKPKTKEDVIKEHLLINGDFYNTIFFGDETFQAICNQKNMEFMNYFYPNLRTHNLHQRLYCSLGGLAADTEIYKILGLRHPLDTDFTKPSGIKEVSETDKYTEELYYQIDFSYNSNSNWFREEAKDLAHIIYCLMLYTLMSKILNDPNFEFSQLDRAELQVLLDWTQHVQYYYDLIQENDDNLFIYAQYLFDLCWNFIDNPSSNEVKVANHVSLCRNMASGERLVASMNESSSLITKEQCKAYMVKELGMPDDIFLLPMTCEYPVINKGSVRMAMDLIPRIDPENIPEYSKNLNRKYKEFGCTFSISVDHPYAKYADQNIVDHMTMVLMEGDTVVDDDGTSAGTTDPIDKAPWNIRNDTQGYVSQDLLQNKELGPNKKELASPNYTQTSAYI